MRRLLRRSILALAVCVVAVTPLESAPPFPSSDVSVEIVEGCKDRDWDSATAAPTEHYSSPVMAFIDLPRKYDDHAVIADRSPVFLVRAACRRTFAAGEYQFLIRASSGSRLFVDDMLLASTDFAVPNAEGHEAVPELKASVVAGIRELPIGHQEQLAKTHLDAGEHRFRFEILVGSDHLRHEIGQPCVAIAAAGEAFHFLSPDHGPQIELTDDAWEEFAAAESHRLLDVNRQSRRARVSENEYWAKRHEAARVEIAKQSAIVPPEVSKEIDIQSDVDRFIGAKLVAAGKQQSPRLDDYALLRRLTLDVVGVLPTRDEIAAFVTDKRPERVATVIDRLLADDRWADNWVGYWQDVLAENPGILKPEMNNTGPFRWWIYESLLDNKPMDRFATELMLMEGSRFYGGPAGFEMATQNDVAMAEKAHVIGKAFLGLEMKCARCHDAPHHPFVQKDLFQIAAMLDRKSIKLPKTSSLPDSPNGHKRLVNVSLKPGESIEPHWPFDTLMSEEVPDGVLRNADNTRERLAALVTSPHNERFGKVLVNRLWKGYMGSGMVEPVDDWSNATPSHPELLDWLAREFVSHDYDLKSVAKLILNSRTYQSVAVEESTDQRLFTGPSRRRMSAEQIVDSLFTATGKPMNSEMLTVDPEIRREVARFFNLGAPTRAWQFTSLSNERDRPALALPVAQGFVDLLTTFGWRDSRPSPVSNRETDPNSLQPLTLANGVLGSRVVGLSDDHSVTQFALADKTPEQLVEQVFLQFLSRPPTSEEAVPFVELLKPGFEQRKAPAAQTGPKHSRAKRTAVSWSNHLNPEATKIKLELEREARAGDRPTERLVAEWRERLEDVIWAVVNSPEFVFIP